MIRTAANKESCSRKEQLIIRPSTGHTKLGGVKLETRTPLNFGGWYSVWTVYFN